MGPNVLLERVAADAPLHHQARLKLVIVIVIVSGTRVGGRAAVAAAPAAAAVTELIRRRAVSPERQGRHWQALEIGGAWECGAVVTVHGACGARILGVAEGFRGEEVEWMNILEGGGTLRGT